MKHFYCLLLLAGLMPCQSAFAQNAFSCATDFLHRQALQEPGSLQRHRALEQDALNHFRQPAAPRGQQALTIPVVVHLIHDNGPENLSDAEVQQAVQWLNDAFANQGVYDQGSGTETDIRFCLARRTPDGQPTSGITRDQSTLTEFTIESQQTALKNINRWNPEDYLNIWVVRSICSAVNGCGISAFAYFPAYHGSNLDGVVAEFGSFGLSSAGAAVLAHEVGHYLGLYHTFEGGCANDDCLQQGDRVCDTPPDQSKAGVPCDQTVNTCFTDALPDMTWNFLDYGNFACWHDFTEGQAARMNFFLTGARKSLLDSKGCLPPCPLPTMAAFTPGDTTILAGQALIFDNTSQNAVTFSWTLNGVPFGSQQNAAYLFDSAGVYSVQLLAQPLNGQLCEPAAAQATVQVVCPVTAEFTLSNLVPEAGQTVYVANNSVNAGQYEWFVNGVSQGAVLDSIIFSSPGEYEILLLAANGFCRNSIKQAVTVREVCTDKTFVLRYNPGSNGLGRAALSSAVLADGTLLFGGIARTDNISFNQKAFLLRMKPDGTLLWAKMIGQDSITIADCPALAGTPDGGFVVLIHQPAPGKDGTRLARFSKDGILVWMRVLPNSANSQTKYHDLIVTPDGGIIAGLIAKFDLAGNLLWYNTQSEIEGYKTALMPDGGFVATGRVVVGSQSGEYLITRYDGQGILLWCKQMMAPANSLLQDYYATDIVAGPDSSIFVLGVRENTVLGGTKHAWLFRLTPGGEVVWSKRYFWKEGFPVHPKGIVFQDGGITIAVENYFNEHCFIRVDPDGNTIWKRQFNNWPYENLTSFTGLPGGGYLATQEYGSTFQLLKIDRLGYAGECKENQSLLEAFNFGVSTVSNTIANTPQPDFPPDMLPVSDFTISLDTLCEPACPRGDEYCRNGLDDDEDGLFDCLDPDCDCEGDICDPGGAKVWYFGNHAGLDFRTEPPTVLSDGKGRSDFAAATASDPSGRLLFYTIDGDTIYNRFHEPMPNGIDITSGGGSTGYGNAEAMIVPHPGDPGKFFVFTSGAIDWQAPRYSLVDMRLDNGRGDVVPGLKSIALTTDAECRLTAVKSCVFNGFWLLMHRFKSDEFVAYKIDSTGLDLNPVLSATGSPDNYFAGAGIGQMKFSPGGEKIARGIFAEKKIEIYDFDPSSGKVGLMYAISLPALPAPTGIEFSPGGRFLYVATYTTLANPDLKLFQLDLEAGNAQEVEKSAVEIANLVHPPFFYYDRMQLAPNGKIYVAQFYAGFPSGFLGIIHKPDLPGASCQFQRDGQPLGPGASSSSLCNFISGYFARPRLSIPGTAADTICIIGSAYPYTAQKTGCFAYDSITWQLDGLPGAVTYTNDTCWVNYTAPGQGRLIVSARTPCGFVADTLPVVVAEPFNKTLDLGPDRVVCDNGVVTLNAGSGFARYRWQDGSPDSVLTTLLPGQYRVEVWDACGNRQADTVDISVAPATVLDLGPDTAGCPGLSAAFQRPGFFSRWQWTPGAFLSCDTCHTMTADPVATTAWTVVAQTVDGCISVDTFTITIRDTLFFGLDTSVCAGQALDLFGAALPADTTVQFFVAATGPGCDTVWTVNVLGLDAPFLQVDTVICPGETFTFHQVVLPADTTATVLIPGVSGECDSVVSVNVSAFPPVAVTLPPDTTLRIGASLTLNAEAGGTDPLSLAWSPTSSLSCTGCSDPVASPLETTLYTLSVSDANGCAAQDSILISVDSLCGVIIPNAFTPNGDGINDRFYPKADPCVRSIRVWRIVSRWGETVFERQNITPNDPALGWDGKRRNGEEFPSDVLAWYVELEHFDKKVEIKKGNIALLR